MSRLSRAFVSLRGERRVVSIIVRSGRTSRRLTCRSLLLAAKSCTMRRNDRAAFILPAADGFGLQLRVRQRSADLFHAADIAQPDSFCHRTKPLSNIVQPPGTGAPKLTSAPDDLTSSVSCRSSWRSDAACITRECCSQAISPGLASFSTSSESGERSQKESDHLSSCVALAGAAGVCHVACRQRVPGMSRAPVDVRAPLPHHSQVTESPDGHKATLRASSRARSRSRRSARSVTRCSRRIRRWSSRSRSRPSPAGSTRASCCSRASI